MGGGGGKGKGTEGSCSRGEGRGIRAALPENGVGGGAGSRVEGLVAERFNGRGDG